MQNKYIVLFFMNAIEVARTHRPGGGLHESLSPNAVILLSGLTPGAGSSSLGRELASRLGADFVGVGERLRSRLGGLTEDDLQARLRTMPDPAAFDRALYDELPKDRRVVVEGKLATVQGRLYLPNDREVMSVYTHTDPVTAARRVLTREEYGLVNLVTDPDSLVKKVNQIEARRAHDIAELGAEEIVFSPYDPVMQERNGGTVVNTGLSSAFEIASRLTSGDPLDKDIETNSIYDFYETVLRAVQSPSGIGLDEREAAHIKLNLDRITYMLRERYPVLSEGPAMDMVRDDVRKGIISVLYPLYRMLPKFFVDGDGELQTDNRSYKWAPEYYKIGRGWEVLKTELAGKDIIDPFGGPGMLMTYLAARGIPNSITLADLSYPGGKNLDDSYSGKINYQPWYNIYLFQSLLDRLPEYYKQPCFANIRGCVTADATKMPFAKNAFDLVVGDPPYGFNLNDGGPDLFFEMLPGLLEVGKEGGLFIIPDEWQPSVARYSEQKGYQAKRLTGDLSLGQSNHPTSMVRIQG